MRFAHALPIVLCAFSASLGPACAPEPKPVAPTPAPSARIIESGQPIPWQPIASPNPVVARKWAWTAIGCWIGGAWSEALGALGEERGAATSKRCTTVAVEMLGAKEDDSEAVRAVATVVPEIVTRVVDAIELAGGTLGEEKVHLLALVRATAMATREALGVRRTVELLRPLATGKDNTVHDFKLEESKSVLLAHEALEKLWKLQAGPFTTSAQGLALMLAADRVEAARGLEPKAKVVVASPAFSMVFGVEAPAEYKVGTWIEYVDATAKAANHPADAAASSTYEREQSAFVGVIDGFADRFEAIAKELAEGDLHEVTEGYARLLRAEAIDLRKKFEARRAAKVNEPADAGKAGNGKDAPPKGAPKAPKAPPKAPAKAPAKKK